MSDNNLCDNAPEPINTSATTSATKSSSRKGVGGTHSHSPNCKCRPCGARHRKEEALTIAARNGGITLAPEFLTTNVKRPSSGNGPVTKKFRERIAQYITYSTAYPNASKREIAEKMGIAPVTLAGYLQRGQKTGILSFNDPLERIEYELIPKVIDNLSHFLDEKDKTITIETAKGTIFRQFQESKGISETQQTVLAIKIEQPDGANVKLVSGHIVGRPKELADPTATDSFVVDLES